MLKVIPLPWPKKCTARGRGPGGEPFLDNDIMTQTMGVYQEGQRWYPIRVAVELQVEVSTRLQEPGLLILTSDPSHPPVILL